MPFIAYTYVVSNLICRTYLDSRWQSFSTRRRRRRSLDGLRLDSDTFHWRRWGWRRRHFVPF